MKECLNDEPKGCEKIEDMAKPLEIQNIIQEVSHHPVHIFDDENKMLTQNTTNNAHQFACSYDLWYLREEP